MRRARSFASAQTRNLHVPRTRIFRGNNLKPHDDESEDSDDDSEFDAFAEEIKQ